MVSRVVAIGLIFAGGALLAIGGVALALAPPFTLDSRDQLIVALAVAGVLFAGLGSRAVLRIS